MTWPIYVLAGVSSAAGAFDLPARQSLVPNLVPREDLPNAISLNTVMVQVASVIGPALGGVVIAEAGVAWAYAGNAVSYLVVIARAADDARRGPARADADGARVDPSATPERLQRGRGARRAALRVSVAAHPIDDAAGFLRDVLLVGHSAPADLRAGRPSRRSARIRLALLGAGRRRRARRRGDGARRRFDRTSRHRADCQHRDLWPRDGCVRPLAPRSG